jgi:uncharacterized protein YlaI
MARIIEYICDICDERVDSARVVEVKWCNTSDYEDYHMCDSCKNTLFASQVDKEPISQSSSRTIFKALLKLFYKRAKSKE